MFQKRFRTLQNNFARFCKHVEQYILLVHSLKCLNHFVCLLNKQKIKVGLEKTFNIK